MPADEPTAAAADSARAWFDELDDGPAFSAMMLGPNKLSAQHRAPARSRKLAKGIKSTIGGILTDLSDNFHELKDAARRHGHDAAQADPSQDPTAWSDTQLKAYLFSAPGQPRLVGTESRDELVGRCCAALGLRHQTSQAATVFVAKRQDALNAVGSGASREEIRDARAAAVAAVDLEEMALFQQTLASCSSSGGSCCSGQGSSGGYATAFPPGPSPAAAANRATQADLLFGRPREDAAAEPEAEARKHTTRRQAKVGDGRGGGRGSKSSSKGGGSSKGSGGGSSSHAAGRSGSGSSSGKAERASEAKRERGRARTAPNHAAEGADQSAAAEAAARRMAQWGDGKGFVAMLNTMADAFEKPLPAEMLLLAESAALSPTAGSAARKKAYHRASKSLHPDRLRALPAERRAEAEECFKLLSAAFHRLGT